MAHFYYLSRFLHFFCSITYFTVGGERLANCQFVVDHAQHVALDNGFELAFHLLFDSACRAKEVVMHEPVVLVVVNGFEGTVFGEEYNIVAL